MGTWYASRERVKAVGQIRSSAFMDAQIDDALENASRAVENLCHRVFYPTLKTSYFDWPNYQRARPWRLWLTVNELATDQNVSLVSGGKPIPSTAYFLEPVNLGPPFTSIELNRSMSYAFGSTQTPQRSIAITGLFGFSANTALSGYLSQAILTPTTTSLIVSDSHLVGVGDTILVDDERINIIGKQSVDSGQNIQVGLSATAANVTVPVQSGSLFSVGEIILVDAERMLIQDIAGNNLLVKRAWDGSVLASHLTNTDIFVPRALMVVRGVWGTIATTHNSGTAIRRHVPPGPVATLTVAEALVTIAEENATYAGSSLRRAQRDNTQRNSEGLLPRPGAGIEGARTQLYQVYGRKSRMLVV